MPLQDDLLAAIGDTASPLAMPPVARLSDAELLDGQRRLAELRRRVDALAAGFAGEIAHRSRRELGHGGLAATRGVRTAEDLVAAVTGSTRREARTLITAAELLPGARSAADRDGAAVGESDAACAQPRWLAVLGEAVADATLSVEQIEVIRTRLGAVTGASQLGSPEPVPAVPDDAALSPDECVALDAALADAAARLIANAPGLTVEQLATRAAAARDDLDLAGVSAREEALRDKRSLRVYRQSDGMTAIHGLLDPESAAIVVPILDAATSPRRGGPRFVDPAELERAADIVADTRTLEQLTLDTLVELVRIGARVDDGTLLGDRKPVVRILVTKSDLEVPTTADGTRLGAAFFDGQPDAISIETAERHICASGAVPILFDDDGRALRLGRTQRLFSEKQRQVIAARDGGCLMCDRPSSWCEAHHIDHWEEHHGRTDVDDGVLLCRHCHLLLHNRRWRIRRRGGDYRLERPDEHGTVRSIPLPSRSRALQRLRITA